MKMKVAGRQISFEMNQSMNVPTVIRTFYYLSRRCFTSSFLEIGPPVPEKKIFKSFYHIWA